jgi:hypothetical protein
MDGPSYLSMVGREAGPNHPSGPFPPSLLQTRVQGVAVIFPWYSTVPFVPGFKLQEILYCTVRIYTGLDDWRMAVGSHLNDLLKFLLQVFTRIRRSTLRFTSGYLGLGCRKRSENIFGFHVSYLFMLFLSFSGGRSFSTRISLLLSP